MIELKEFNTVEELQKSLEHIIGSKALGFTGPCEIYIPGPAYSVVEVKDSSAQLKDPFYFVKKVDFGSEGGEYATYYIMHLKGYLVNALNMFVKKLILNNK